MEMITDPKVVMCNVWQHLMEEEKLRKNAGVYLFADEFDVEALLWKLDGYRDDI